jgi:hypothetical protein
MDGNCDQILVVYMYMLTLNAILFQNLCSLVLIGVKREKIREIGSERERENSNNCSTVLLATWQANFCRILK